MTHQRRPGILSRAREITLFVFAASAAGCGPPPESALDEASVIVNNTSVRADATSSSRTLFRLAEGERVEILGKNGAWYRVRDAQDFEGWMEESTLIRDRTLGQMQAMLAEWSEGAVQNTVTTLDEVNLRLAPGRETDVVRRLRRNVVLEVLDRATTPRPGTDATDIWFLVRRDDEEIGWVFAQLVEFSTPEELQPYTEGRVYAAVKVLDEVVDPEAGTVRWYVIGERRPGAPAHLAYDGIRIFTWNLALHRYETALRLGGLPGAYPVEIIGGDRPGFRFHVLDENGEKTPRSFEMRGTAPREIR